MPAVVPDRVGDGERPAVRRPRRIVVLTGWRDGALDAIELVATTLSQKPCAMPELRTAVLEPKQFEEA